MYAIFLSDYALDYLFKACVSAFRDALLEEMYRVLQQDPTGKKGLFQHDNGVTIEKIPFENGYRITFKRLYHIALYKVDEEKERVEVYDVHERLDSY